MEKKEDVKQANPEEFPSLIKYIASKSVKGFDTTPNLQVDTVFANVSDLLNFFSSSQSSAIHYLINFCYLFRDHNMQTLIHIRIQ